MVNQPFGLIRIMDNKGDKMKDECVKCKKTAIQLDDADKLYWYCTHTHQEEMYGVDEGKEFLLCEMCFPKDELMNITP